MVDFSVKSTVNWDISNFYHANNYESLCIYIIVFIPIDNKKEKKKDKETKKEEAPIPNKGSNDPSGPSDPRDPNGPKKKEMKKEESPGPKGKFFTFSSNTIEIIAKVENNQDF